MALIFLVFKWLYGFYYITSYLLTEWLYINVNKVIAFECAVMRPHLFKMEINEIFQTSPNDYLATEQGVNISIRDCLSPFHDLVILSCATLAKANR